MLDAKQSFIEAALKSNKILHLDEKQTACLKSMLYEMLCDIRDYCDQNGITYMIAGGTMLGAVRHGGFIPWDDDLDIIMPRQDYDRFISQFEKDMGERYVVQSPQNCKKTVCPFMKIRKKGTTFIEIGDVRADVHKGIYIDVFPMEKIPAPGFKRKLHGTISLFLSYVSACVTNFKYRSKLNAEFSKASPEAAKIYRMSLIAGCIGSVIPLHGWQIMMEKWNARYKNKNTAYIAFPYGRKHYFGETLEESIMLPPCEITFEGGRFKGPGQWEKYLKNLYGNYMMIPPPEKREMHFVVRFDPEKENFEFQDK